MTEGSRKEGIWLSPEGEISLSNRKAFHGGFVYVTLYRTEVGAGSGVDSLLKVRQNQCQVSTRLVFSLEVLEKNLLQAPWVVGSTWPLVSVRLRSPFS